MTSRLRLVLAVEADFVVGPAEVPKLVGRALDEALSRLRETGQIGAGPVVIGLLNARRTRPRREPSASRAVHHEAT